jgi:hypothetical protein
MSEFLFGVTVIALLWSLGALIDAVAQAADGAIRDWSDGLGLLVSGFLWPVRIVGGAILSAGAMLHRHRFELTFGTGTMRTRRQCRCGALEPEQTEGE